MKQEPGKIDTSDQAGPVSIGPRCGTDLGDGRVCRVYVPAAGLRCALHQDVSPGDLEARLELPAGVVVPTVFPKDQDRQRALEGYVAEIYRDYTGLNTGADLRQILVAGAAYVRLVHDCATMEPKALDFLSKIVDRHLRNLKATPKEIADGQARGVKGGAQLGALAAAAGVGALLERVRATMTPGQLKALQAGGAPRGLGVEAMGAPGAGVEVPQDDDDQTADPFGD
ncbi:MAG: hypothetical protein Q8O14_07615 [bacterium]|nr:hypothetical protein [bacterium]